MIYKKNQSINQSVSKQQNKQYIKIEKNMHQLAGLSNIFIQNFI